MNAPLYRIPGVAAPADVPAPSAVAEAVARARTVGEVLAQSQVEDVLAELDRDLVGLAPVKARIRDIAALLVIDKLRGNLGLTSQAPPLHMSFTGNPGTGKTTVAMRMATILHRLGYVRKGHLVAVTRDDLVGQYIGHTAPKTKEVLKKAMGGVLFIDEAYYLYRPENERDYGQEAIEILLQVMENHRDDLIYALAAGGWGARERISELGRVGCMRDREGPVPVQQIGQGQAGGISHGVRAIIACAHMERDQKDGETDSRVEQADQRKADERHRRAAYRAVREYCAPSGRRTSAGSRTRRAERKPGKKSR